MNRNTRWIVTSLGALGIALCAVSAAKLYIARTAVDESVAAASPPLPGGPFALVDHTGRAITERDFRGKFMLVFFGYTFCPDVCPTDLQIISNAMDMLGPDGERVQPIFITLDPERDTVKVLAEYVSHFHPRLIGLTGAPAQVKAAAKAYRAVYYKVYPLPFSDESEEKDETDTQDDNANYLVAHSAVTYLMGPDGRFLKIFDHESDPKRMADGIRVSVNDTPS